MYIINRLRDITVDDNDDDDMEDDGYYGKNESTISRSSGGGGGGKHGPPPPHLHDIDGDSEVSEEETSSYLARGREITEVNKIIKRPFRKAVFCRFEVSIMKRNDWPPKADIPVTGIYLFYFILFIYIMSTYLYLFSSYTQ